MLEQAFARGSSTDTPRATTPTPTSDGVPAATERPEYSVMEGLPAAKAERVAAMRREMAELQRQLSEAQQRIASEAQARAEDAERFEAAEDALEAKLHAQEAKAQQDAVRTGELATEIGNLKLQLSTIGTTTEELRREVASRDTQLEDVRQQHRAIAEQLDAKHSSLNEAKSLLTEAKTLLESRESELAARTAERDTEQAAKTRLERELEEQRKQHGEVSTQLESHVTSLRDANALVATRNTELAAMTSERDALKSELAATRAKEREVANQLTRLAFDLTEGAGDAPVVATGASATGASGTGASVTGASTEPAHEALLPKLPERQKPPPVPRAAEPAKVETIVVTEEPKSRSGFGLALVGGLLLGAVATFAFMKYASSSSTTEERHEATPTSAALATEHAPDPTPPVETQPGTAPSASQAQPTTAENNPNGETNAPVAAPTEPNPNGVIVLPQEAEDHRVFVDGKVVPVKNSRAVVPCGTREIRIGSRGTPRSVDVACGAETTVPADPNDR